MSEVVVQALQDLVNPTNVGLMLIGLVAGLIGGALPGINGPIVMALLLPFTFGMPPIGAVILLVSTQAGTMYGTSIPAILIKTPGTSSSIMTTIDGYALHLQGKSGKALGISLYCGTVASVITAILFLVLAIPLAQFALRFGPPEYFSVAVFGLAAVSGLAGKNVIKAFISVIFGLVIATIGVDPFTGARRFDFGSPELAEGFAVTPVLIGLFALSEVMDQASKMLGWEKMSGRFSAALPTLAEFRSVLKASTLGAIIGLIVGIMPGAGGNIAAIVAYNEAKRWSKHPEQFGKGSLEGVAGPEAANNSDFQGALVPLLTLGIPGTATAAILMVALIGQGIRPGPQLFEKNPELVAVIFGTIIVSALMMMVIGLVFMQLCIRIVNIEQSTLLAGILAVVVVGAYAAQNSVYDVGVALIFGVIGYLMVRFDFNPAATVLGLVLGNIVEYSFRQAMILSDGSPLIFVVRPISAFLLVLAVLTLAYPFIVDWLSERKKPAAVAAEGEAVGSRVSDTDPASGTERR